MHSQVIEYASDLREFWKRGYGHDINSKASCGLFHDVFNRLNRAASENRQVNVSNSSVLNATTQNKHHDTRDVLQRVYFKVVVRSFACLQVPSK